MAVRLAIKEDIGLLAAIEQSAAGLFRDTVMEFAMDDPPLDQAILQTALMQNSLWVDEQDGTLAGFLCAHRTGALLYIDELAVAADYQGLGAGRALMECCLGAAQDRFDGIALTTDRELPWNAPFYAQLGFAIWDDPPASTAAKLAEEIAHGFDPHRRYAMILRLD